jgi:hypothetical protein
MDPITLAAGAVALLTAFLGKAGGEFAGEAGRAAWGLASRLFGRLRSAVQDKPQEQQVLDNFSAEPAVAAAPAREMLQGLLARDPALAAEISDVLAQIKQLGPTVTVNQRITEAETVVGVEARRLRAGTINVDQQVDKGGSVTGVKIGDDFG